MEEITVQEAMSVLLTAFANDPGYRDGWKANIAMAFVDVFKAEAEDGKVVGDKQLHYIANHAAERFLRSLLNHNKEEGCTMMAGSESITSLFDRALNKSIKDQRQKESIEKKELSDASNIVLKHAAPSSSPDQFGRLEAALVDLFRYRFSV